MENVQNLLLDLMAYEIQFTKNQIWSMRTYFMVFGPFREHLVFWQKAILAIFSTENSVLRHYTVKIPPLCLNDYMLSTNRQF